jgi:hypothetical protein
VNNQIQFHGDLMRIRFERFDMDSYATFLKAKRLPEYRIEVLDPDELSYEITAPARFAPMLGVPSPAPVKPDLPLPEFLLDDQAAIVQMALAAKRFAIWKDCGLGKTLEQLEFCRQVVHRTSGRALIVTRNSIVGQFFDESQKFYGDALHLVGLTSRQMVREWCATGRINGQATGEQIGITNVEKFIPEGPDDQVMHECRHLAAFDLDEASILKSGGGKIKWALIKSARGVEYKVAATATPAPNEVMEFASQASFLEKLRDENEILWTYFTRDPKTHRWSVKKHARKAFFEFMAGWSIYVRDPKRYGWREKIDPPPEPQTFVHLIKPTEAQRHFILDFNARVPAPAGDRSNTASMFATEVNATTGIKLSQAAKGFVYSTVDGRKITPIESNKPEFVADLIVSESAMGLQVLVWTEFNEETRILDELLRSHPKFKRKSARDLDILTGDTPDADRDEILDDFRKGACRVLISRASMLGFGMNLQMCGSMIFSGWSFSFEQYYQAVRRAYRFGQTNAVRVHIPVISELEGQMFEAICRKDRQQELAIAEMEENYIAARRRIGAERPVREAGKVECAA